MKIAYVGRSSFLAACEVAIRQQRPEADTGDPIRIEFGKSGGYCAREVVTIEMADADFFEIEKEYAEPTRFPARIRAAATALRNCRFFGTFEIEHSDGQLVIKRFGSKVDAKPQPAIRTTALPQGDSSGIGNGTALLKPPKLWSSDEVFGQPSPVPKQSGVYAWYFRTIPRGVPTEGCVMCGSLALLYVGIAPKAPPRNGTKPSSQRLVDRIRYHYRGNAEGSTLRLTLGCLLEEELGISLHRVGSGKRFTFTAEGESRLSAWMQRNAFVAWTIHATPWVLEEKLVGQLSLPLNLQMNRSHAFHSELSGIRRKAKTNARNRPIFQ